MNPKFVQRLKDAFPEEYFPDAVNDIIAIIEGTKRPDEFESVQRWVRSCWHEPKMIDQKLCAINEILGGHGVEAIFGDDPRWPDMDYINLGDTYTTTIVWDRLKARWRCMSWGDWVEEAEAEGRVYQ